MYLVVFAMHFAKKQIKKIIAEKSFHAQVGPLSGVRLQVSSTHVYLYEPAHSCTSGSSYANECHRILTFW